MRCFKLSLYLIVLYCYSVCNAGSYDDFFSAIKRDDPDAVLVLLSRGFDANTLNPAGDHGLIVGIREPSPKVISVLLGWPGVDVEARTRSDESPLMMAALKGNAELCLQLIAKGADVNKPGWTALHYAATNGHVAVLTLLLDKHAYIDAASPNGTTPLMMAAHYGTPEAVKLLLEAGADPMLKNAQSLRALEFAQRANRLDSVEVITSSMRGRHPKGTW
jgi:ankyrin repeat protein